MKNSIRRWFPLLLGLLISGIALYFAFRATDWNEVWGAFLTARIEYLVLGALLIPVSTLARGMRWSVMLQGRINPLEGTSLFTIGQMANNVLPARLGEMVKAVLVARRPSVNFTMAVSSIVVERLFDLGGVVMVLAATVILLPLPEWATAAGIVMAIGSVSGIIVLAWAARWPEPALRLGTWALALLPMFSKERARALLEPFVDGLAPVRDWRTFGLTLLWTVIAWAVSVVLAWVVMLAFFPNAPFPMGMLALAAAGLGVSFPSAPANVGTFQAAIIAVLVAAGYDRSHSQSYSIALHAITFVMINLQGLISLLFEGVNPREVIQSATAAREHEPLEEVSP
jgi:hypothetical protein